MSASFKAQLNKLVRRPAVWILVGIWGLLTVLFGYLIPDLVYTYSHSQSPGDRANLVASMIPSGLLGNSIGSLPVFGGAVVIIGGAMALGSEYGWGTIITNFIQKPGRMSVVGGIFASLVIWAIVFDIVMLGLSVIGSYIVAKHLGLSTAFPSASDWIRGIWVSLLIMVVWIFAGAFLAILTKGTTFAVGIGLVYLLVIASLISGFAGDLTVLRRIDDYLPRKNAGALASHFLGAAGTPGVTHSLSETHAALVMIGYGVGFLLISLGLMRGRDLA